MTFAVGIRAILGSHSTEHADRRGAVNEAVRLELRRYRTAWDGHEAIHTPAAAALRALDPHEARP
jgi:hypothetical protein